MGTHGQGGTGVRDILTRCVGDAALAGRGVPDTAPGDGGQIGQQVSWYQLLRKMVYFSSLAARSASISA